jgi:hypothetical protein
MNKFDEAGSDENESDSGSSSEADWSYVLQAKSNMYVMFLTN